ncbi:MAG: hypothetical protein LBM61_07665 [Prevotellaceae bacterium]|nr:hypothetical protein [Prevotellaceae bacterium]
MKITKSVSNAVKPHNLTASQDSLTSGFGSLTPQALNLRNPMQAERSDAQLGVVMPPLTTTPAGVEPTSGFSVWGTPVLRVSPAVTQIERLRRSATLLRTSLACLWRSATPLRTLTSQIGVDVRRVRTSVACLWRSATPAIPYSDSIYSDISKQTKFIGL